MKPTLKALLAAGAAAGAVLAGTVFLRAVASAPEWARAALLSPFRLNSRTASGAVVLQQIQKLQRLETCRYNGQVIVKGETRNALPAWLAGDRLLFVGRGEVVAGIDLARLRPEDLRVTGERVTVRLPAPEVLYTRLDNRQSEVYEHSPGLFTGPDRTLEGRVRTEAEERLRSAAVESGLLSTAEGNARDTLRRHLELLGFREVRFTTG